MKIYESRYGYSKHDIKECKRLIWKIIRDKPFRFIGFVEHSNKSYTLTNNIKYYVSISSNTIYIEFSHTIFFTFDATLFKKMAIKLGVVFKGEK